MADFENENPESLDFINVDKPEADVEPEPTQPQVTSTTEDMDSSQPEAEETFEKEESESVPEESPKELEEKPAETPTATEPDSSSSSSSTKELTSFPARWLRENNVDQRECPFAADSQSCLYVQYSQNESDRHMEKSISLTGVIDLLYWRNIKKSAVVLAVTLTVLISLTIYSLLSVITFFSMAVLTVALLYRVGMTVMGAIQKSGTENPFKSLLEKDIEISLEKASDYTELVVSHINCGLKRLRRLFLVEDIVDSIKFGVVLWVLSYVGAWFSMLTLVIVATILSFSLPRIYEDHQGKIDDALKKVNTQLKAIIEQAKSKLPEKLRPKEKTT